MNALQLLLLVVPGLPLLLAWPALHTRLSRPAYIALLPATALLFTPTGSAVELPWVLFGTAGLGFDTTARWWLAMSLPAWLTAGFLLQQRAHPAGREMTWYLLCLSGQLGALLSSDMVTFFAASSLMGYAFYGLLAAARDAAGERARRWYLVLLVSADILLFEALLIAASSGSTGFDQVAGNIASSSSVGLYLSMVIVGFTLKAGLWPFHLWLPPAYRSAHPAVAVLLWVVPVATGLLGLLRWLPLGEFASPWAGALLQGFGACGVVYILLFGLRRLKRRGRTACMVIMATGASGAILGAGLVDPHLWTDHGHLLPVALGIAGLGLTATIVNVARRSGGRIPPPAASATATDQPIWLERRIHSLVAWGKRAGAESVPRLRTDWNNQWRHFLAARGWERFLTGAGEQYLQRWAIASLLFLVLIILTTVVLFLADASAS